MYSGDKQQAWTSLIDHMFQRALVLFNFKSTRVSMVAKDQVMVGSATRVNKDDDNAYMQGEKGMQSRNGCIYI